MIFVDTHTHLYLDTFDNDRDEMIKNALSKGVQYMLLPNIDSASAESLLSLCKNFPDNCLPMMGLHPTSVKENYQDELNYIEQKLSENKYVAIGECGIDLYWDTSHFDFQEIVFRLQIEWALLHKLPLVIHSRNSFEEIYNILCDFQGSGLCGVFHCFSGNSEQADKALNLGFYLGIGGVVTFKNSGLNEILKNIPMERIVLETDSPFLAPVPYRGKRNESSYLPLIAEKVARIRQMTLEQVAEITTENARNLFQIPS
jgi:TatD DNase family protein